VQVDFRRLEHFLKIAELGSLSRAADRMRIAQPALSRQMRILEEEAGTPLFFRHRRGMQLTPAGEELRQHIAGPVRQVRQAFDDIRSRSTEGGGQIALGVPPTVSYILAGRLARRVAQQAPNISLRIVEGYAGHLIDWLQRGEIDAALLYGPAADFQMSVAEILYEELVLVGPASSALHPDKRVSVQDISQLPIVLPSQSHGLRLVVEAAARKAGVTLNVRYEADSFLVLKELVEFGLGYTVLPLSALSREIDAGNLRYASIGHPPILRQLVMGMPREEQLTRSTRVVVGLVRDEIKHLVDTGVWKAQLQY
jgi:DNA-binding transcriptional LysR family regulator